ncbi:ATP-binding protein [Limnobacter litoralis]|uniref:ATPase n=1 Tax=Limnobacter litoralis TaxID=481366 RepID=A0ABQ5YX04_9BURK|nr:ATP-binding protein [Limnobacter litoralis]GLR27032.1 ATPase [Limnobacter litoralis]
MIDRKLHPKLQALLNTTSAVVLTGPRQVGKTTLALMIQSQFEGSVYLDLESPRDLAKITDFEGFCDLNEGRLIVLDEIQRVPNLFAPLRGVIDRRRRKGHKTGQFLLLGSAALELLQQTSETLAGRVSYLELNPLSLDEVEAADLHKLWLRGGFPDSFGADSDSNSLLWRENFVRTYLERDIPQLGPRIPAETLRRFWTMLAHTQGGLLNSAGLARGLDISGVTVGRYVDLMVDLLLVRRLPLWESNVGKRLTKAPKIHVRDSGICHALLGIGDVNTLLGHPVCGGSWEGFVIENLLSCTNRLTSRYGHYRSSGGAEVALLIELKPGVLWAIEIKLASAPTLSKGFFSACDDLKPQRQIVVHGGNDSFKMKGGVDALSLADCMAQLSQAQND